jgi:hypothetical protein
MPGKQYLVCYKGQKEMRDILNKNCVREKKSLVPKTKGLLIEESRVWCYSLLALQGTIPITMNNVRASHSYALQSLHIYECIENTLGAINSLSHSMHKLFLL